MRRKINEVLCVEIKKYISAVEGIDSPYTMARIFSKLILWTVFFRCVIISNGDIYEYVYRKNQGKSKE